MLQVPFRRLRNMPRDIIIWENGAEYTRGDGGAFRYDTVLRFARGRSAGPVVRSPLFLILLLK